MASDEALPKLLGETGALLWLLFAEKDCPRPTGSSFYAMRGAHVVDRNLSLNLFHAPQGEEDIGKGRMMLRFWLSPDETVAPEDCSLIRESFLHMADLSDLGDEEPHSDSRGKMVSVPFTAPQSPPLLLAWRQRFLTQLEQNSALLAAARGKGLPGSAPVSGPSRHELLIREEMRKTLQCRLDSLAKARKLPSPRLLPA